MLDFQIGLNLGDGLDCFLWDALPEDELTIESSWTGCTITKETISAIRDAGFRTVRLPVSWHNHVTADYIIHPRWLARVQQVVDWCLACDLYVILNIHHDNFKAYLYPSTPCMANSLRYVTTIWRQLAMHFRDYDERLVFNGMNEPRLVGHLYEWRVDLTQPDVADAVACINQLNQAFVDTVRETGGQNRSRYLLCPAYDAAPEGALCDAFRLPVDTGNAGRIIVSVHAYVPYLFALAPDGVAEWSAENPEDVEKTAGFMPRLYEKFIQKGIPVLIDEFGARHRDNLQTRCAWAACYITEAKKYGMACLWWDNNRFLPEQEMFGLLNRRDNTWQHVPLVETLIQTAKKEDGQ